jgi:hypothetical protein
MSVTSRAHQEKRSFIRMHIDTMVSFTLGSSSTQRYEARCKDISGAGMLLETNKKLVLGQKLHVEVPSEGLGFENLQALVEVIRVEAFPNKHLFLVGVVIKKVS